MWQRGRGAEGQRKESQERLGLLPAEWAALGAQLKALRGLLCSKWALPLSRRQL